MYETLNKDNSKKDRKIETYEINKISLPCFDDKIYIQDNGYDGLLLSIRVNL